jgi:sensor c-di-GMP phosphodiesterase-like protein
MKRKDDRLLEQAISGGAIHPVFQPVVDMETGQIIGAEVLARWVLDNEKSVPR